ncbi:MAG: LytTR family DNA-binding domain-containing protein [Weeksellaceae bacterium]
MQKLRAIIVDDESDAIKNLKWEIEQFCEGIDICETFTDPMEAISGINYLKPDCVFLDIEMPEIDGFQLLKNLSFKDFEIIFTTAYDQYALKAFRAEAIDYLLKPIDTDDLRKSIARVRERKKGNGLGENIKDFLDSFNSKKNERLALNFSGKIKFVELGDIIYCKSNGSYTEIYLNEDKTEILSKKIKEVEELTNEDFFRVHNSYLVNLNYIYEYIKADGHYLLLKDGTTVPISRSKRNELLKKLNV